MGAGRAGEDERRVEGIWWRVSERGQNEIGRFSGVLKMEVVCVGLDGDRL